MHNRLRLLLKLALLLCALPVWGQWIDTDSVLHVPASVRSLPDFAYAGRDDIAEVRFEAGSKLTKIGDYAFWQCGSLRRVEFPASVTQLGEGCLKECG
ncbi:MAG: leucine-rich repeat domain-containing protein, partial [Muribaculaceae bacterium]|nr:leucine-rich repeat domain-containing protein [Muribaculaceae bacterium]